MGGKCRAIWKAQSLRSFPFQIVFISTEGWRRYDFIIVGGNTMKLSLIILTLLILDANGVNIPDYCWIFFGCSVAVNTFFNWLDIKYFNPRLPRGRRRQDIPLFCLWNTTYGNSCEFVVRGAAFSSLLWRKSGEFRLVLVRTDRGNGRSFRFARLGILPMICF